MRQICWKGVLLSVSILVAACGGGSGGGSPTPSEGSGGPSSTAVISAGLNKSVTAGGILIMDGSASTTTSGGSLTYVWNLIAKPSGSAATLVAPDTVKPILKTDLVGTYRISLQVNDAASTSKVAFVDITAEVAPAPVAPPAIGANAVALAVCGEITSSGSYVLQADIDAGSNRVPCLNIHDTSNVHLDCAGHTVRSISGISIVNVQNFSVAHCKFVGGEFGQTEILHVGNSTDGLIAQSHFSPPVTTHPVNSLMVRAQRITFDSNTYVGALQMINSHYITVSNNRFSTSLTNNFLGAMVVFSWGSHNSALNNYMDGKWVGFPGPTWTMNGADDGVLIFDEPYALVANNVIENVADAGIELGGSVPSLTVRGNYIRNPGVVAIGGWYYLSVSHATFSENVAEDADRFFLFTRLNGMRSAQTNDVFSIPADTAVLFRDNVFSGNVIVDTTPLINWSVGTWSSEIHLFDLMAYTGTVGNHPTGERVAEASEFQLTNNVFKNNVFAKTLAGPWFGSGAIVEGRVIDGGGNYCKPPPTGPSPLRCN